MILEHFDVTHSTSHILYKLRGKERVSLLGKFPAKFRQCYITDSSLDEMSKKIGITKSEFLQKYIIPDKPNIVSGDFGEIFSYYAIRDSYDLKGIKLVGPKKWQFKIDKNKPVMGADAVLFHRVNSVKPSKKDVLVSIESKMKSVHSNEHRIQSAIDGAELDSKSRIAKTLIWLEEKHAKDGQAALVKFIQRFNDPATHGDYIKDFTAIAILDTNFETDEISKTVTNKSNVTVIVMSIDELKKAYEDTRNDIIKSV